MAFEWFSCLNVFKVASNKHKCVKKLINCMMLITIYSILGILLCVEAQSSRLTRESRTLSCDSTNWNDYQAVIKASHFAIDVAEFTGISKILKSKFDPLILDPIIVPPFSAVVSKANYTFQITVDKLNIVGLNHLVLKPTNTSIHRPTVLKIGTHIRSLKVRLNFIIPIKRRKK